MSVLPSLLLRMLSASRTLRGVAEEEEEEELPLPPLLLLRLAPGGCGGAELGAETPAEPRERKTGVKWRVLGQIWSAQCNVG